MNDGRIEVSAIVADVAVQRRDLGAAEFLGVVQHEMPWLWVEGGSPPREAIRWLRCLEFRAIGAFQPWGLDLPRALQVMRL